jgi:uncharacterized protein (DUF2126 family)
VFGIGYRAFVPQVGLYPRLEPQGPVTHTVLRDDRADALRITLHDCRPGDRAYDGLPRDGAAARQRRDERFVVEHIERVRQGEAMCPPVAALSSWCLGLRYMAVKLR